MRLYAGIDLHSNNSVLAVVDAAGERLYRRRHANELLEIEKALRPYRDDLDGVVVESTFNWYWLVDGLQDAGYRMHLANTAAVVQYEGLKHGDDHTDAEHLAHLLRLGILPEGYIYPRELRSLRDALRRRMLLVQQNTRLMHSVQSQFARHTGRRLSANAFVKLGEADFEDAFADPMDRESARLQHRLWRTTRTELRSLERRLVRHVPESGTLVRLRSTPGIGLVLGLTILLETGPIERFDTAGNYASYCRLVESRRVSNGKTKGRGNRKCGNRYLAWAYIEAANFATRYSEPIRCWHQRKSAHKHAVIARKATAHKIARGCYHVMRDGVDFDVNRAFN